MTNMEMLDEVIRTLGFENKMTIWFARLVEEDYPDDMLEVAMAIALERGI